MRFLTIIALLLIISECYNILNDRIFLQDVKMLTFRKDESTNNRRYRSSPKLICIGGSMEHRWKEVNMIQCRNVDRQFSNINWHCESILPFDLSLGKTEIICEGYNHPNDTYVLKDSCFVEYELNFREIKQDFNLGRKNIISIIFIGLSMLYIILFTGCLRKYEEKQINRNYRQEFIY